MRKYLILFIILFAVATGIVFSVPMVSASDEGMILRWEFEEESGTTVLDTSSYENNGTIVNGGTREPGIEGGGIRLNGTNQYVQSSSPIASLGTVNRPYALSTWIKVDEGETNGNIVHISSNANGGNWCIPFLRLEGGFFQATGWYNNTSTTVADDTPVVANQWYQVLTSWDPENGLRLFVDGELVGSTPQAGHQAFGAPVYYSLGLGNNNCSDNQGFLDGMVDDARLYDRALSNNDIDNIIEGNETTQSTTTTTSAATTTSTLIATTTPFVENGPNNGDGNDDGIADVEQPNVTTIVNTVLGTKNGYVVLAAPSTCLNERVEIISKSEAGINDNFFYPAGVLDFTIDCGTPGVTVTVEHYYYGLDFQASDFIGRKYSVNNGVVQTLTGSSITQEIIDNKPVVKLVYSLTDGNELDDDGSINGTIIDPAGLATTRELPATGSTTSKILIPAFMLLSLGVILILTVKRLNGVTG